jgi:hypothetical protein
LDDISNAPKRASPKGKIRSRFWPHTENSENVLVGLFATSMLLNWMKVGEFDGADRRKAFGQSIARLQQGSSAAATTLFLLKLLIDQGKPASFDPASY